MKQGISLLEILAVMAIMGSIFLVSIPAFQNFLVREALTATSIEFSAAMHACRQMAITRNHYVGIKFICRDGVLYYGVFEDGDQDGIRTQDINSGIDLMVKPFLPMQFSQGKIIPGILSSDIPDIYTGGHISNPEDPVKFGRGNICSFSPLGASSPGTIYLTDNRSLQAAVRIFATSAYIRTFVYDDVSGWREK